MVTYFFLSLSFLSGCCEVACKDWDCKVSTATFRLLKAFISSSSSLLFSSTFLFSSWCILFKCSNFSCSWQETSALSITPSTTQPRSQEPSPHIPQLPSTTETCPAGGDRALSASQLKTNSALPDPTHQAKRNSEVTEDLSSACSPAAGLRTLWALSFLTPLKMIHLFPLQWCQFLGPHTDPWDSCPTAPFALLSSEPPRVKPTCPKCSPKRSAPPFTPQTAAQPPARCTDRGDSCF